jgi:G:T-mismatch repair DNA endonuclease (very short patch repair protein)
MKRNISKGKLEATKRKINLELATIMHLCNNMTITEIAKSVGVHRDTLSKHLRLAGIKIKPAHISVAIRGTRKGTFPKGNTSPMKGKHLRDYFTEEEWEARKTVIAEQMRLRWQNAEYRDQIVKATHLALHKRPNKPETKLIQLFNEWRLPYKFVGDGTFIIAGFNPDFIHTNGLKHIIEFFGIYWHQPKDEIIRKQAYAKYGFQTLIIWEPELSNPSLLKQKVMQFEENNVD